VAAWLPVTQCQPHWQDDRKAGSKGRVQHECRMSIFGLVGVVVAVAKQTFSGTESTASMHQRQQQDNDQDPSTDPSTDSALFPA